MILPSFIEPKYTVTFTALTTLKDGKWYPTVKMETSGGTTETRVYDFAYSEEYIAHMMAANLARYEKGMAEFAIMGTGFIPK